MSLDRARKALYDLLTDDKHPTLPFLTVQQAELIADAVAERFKLSSITKHK